jgi:uncharacterized protein (TIGR04255 family)
MTEPEHLARAPIVEAALAITVTLPSTVDQEKLASLQERLGDRYPTKHVSMSWTGQFEVRPGAAPETKTSSGPLGYVFTSKDGKQVVQARKDAFVFSRLHPYKDWETFSKEARELWGHYVAVAKPEKVNRLELRYINRIELPLPLNDLKEYLLTGPEIAPDLPQRMAGFFFQVVIPLEQVEALATITETVLANEATKDVLPVVLDIDVFRNGVFPAATDKLWPLFNPLHDAKNLLFFKSLTPKAKELFA